LLQKSDKKVNENQNGNNQHAKAIFVFMTKFHKGLGSVSFCVCETNEYF